AGAAAIRRAPPLAGGRKPWQAHARPFDAQDKRPRVALIVVGLGLNSAVTESAIRELPGGVTLAFSPYADNLERWIDAARATAHEVLLALPMEPLSFPLQDPGPHTLLTTLSPRENLDRLAWALGRAGGYAGVIDTMGSRFVASLKDLAPVLGAINERGLLFVDSGSAPDSVVARAAAQIGLPWTVSARTIDDRANRSAIDASLGELERLARQQGRAVGIGTPLPITLARIAEWAAKLEERGVVLAPASATIRENAAG
ncbi:MAG: divergent polysaccharide deacetylase family protein, partial [Alphaproteobacteria bacterium]|nr:divergent polysaccharide deacetylase family protein [Alphaproteobacteria bacterium]